MLASLKKKNTRINTAKSNRINKHSKISQKSDEYLNKAWRSKLNHTPKAYIHQNWTLNHTPKLNPNCHIQSIKPNTAIKAMHNIQSEIRK